MKKCNPTLPSRSWNTGKGDCRHYHSQQTQGHSGSWNRLYQGWGVFKGGTWVDPKPYMPRTLQQVSAAMELNILLYTQLGQAKGLKPHVMLKHLNASTLLGSMWPSLLYRTMPGNTSSASEGSPPMMIW